MGDSSVHKLDDFTLSSFSPIFTSAAY